LLANEESNIMRKLTGSLLSLFVLAGCGSAYSGIVDQSGLGAAQYLPAVYVIPGNEAMYQQVLGICRQSALNRQMTSAQEAQLKTITGVARSTAAGAAAGVQSGQTFGVISDVIGGGDVDVGEQALIGAATGLITGLVDAFASGSEDTAAETKRIMLNCLRVASNNGEHWRVLE
jgi:hypothetical protein